MQIVRTVPADAWPCHLCGVLGIGWTKHDAEAHITKEHPND